MLTNSLVSLAPMASEPDDNPFARTSVWPTMPQAPFRVGSLPDVGGTAMDPGDAAPEPPARTITPLFVRPIGTPPPSGLAMGGAVPKAPTVAVIEAAPEPEAFELSEVVVIPADRVQPPRPRPRGRSRAPAIAASAIGLGAVAAVALLLSRTSSAPTASPTAVTIPIATQPALPTLAPPTVELAAAAPPVKASPAAAGPPRPPAAARTPNPPPRPRSDAALATEEAINATVLTLPPAPPQATPEPRYQPPAAADPGAPIRTQRPY